jgi:type I restriction enzyme S subunit
VAAHFDLLLDRPEAVDALEQTILQLAVRGLLVPQDPEDEPASVLLQRIRAENDRLIAEGKIKRDKASLITNQETPFELPAGWEWRTLDACLEHQREISYGVIKLGVEPRTGGVPTLRCSDIKPGWINLSGVRKVSEEIEAEYSRTRLRGGEILLNIRGTLGGVALTTNTLAGYNVAREVAVIPINRSLNGAFFIYVMLSQYFWKAIQDDLRGIAYKGLNLGSLRTFPIPLPPLAEQSRIVARVEELRQLCNVLRQRLASSQTTQGHLAEALAEDLTA